MRVLFIWHGAVEKNYRKLFKEMVQDGNIELTIITSSSWYEAAKYQSFEYIDFDSLYKVYPLKTIFTNHVRAFFYLNLLKIGAIIFKEKFDVIYIKEEPYSTACFSVVLLAKLLSPKSKIVIESDENIFKKHPFPFGLFEWFSLKNSDSLVVVPSVDGKEVYRKKGYNKNIFTTSYFVDDYIFSINSQESKSIFLPEAQDFKLKIGYVGRIAEEKGIDIILFAMRIMKEKGKEDIALYIVGGIDTSSNYYKELMDISERLEVKVFFLGSLNLDKIFEFYKAIDVLVLPSRTKSWWKEQFGRVLVESMACGTPCVGSSSGEIPAVIGDSRFIFKEDDPEDLARILEGFYSGVFSKERLRNYLIDRAKNFSVKEVAKNKIDIIKST
ncbi:MAG: glycosyltransferase [Brevinematia bacterium]